MKLQKKDGFVVFYKFVVVLSTASLLTVLLEGCGSSALPEKKGVKTSDSLITWDYCRKVSILAARIDFPPSIIKEKLRIVIYIPDYYQDSVTYCKVTLNPGGPTGGYSYVVPKTSNALNGTANAIGLANFADLDGNAFYDPTAGIPRKVVGVVTKYYFNSDTTTFTTEQFIDLDEK